MNRISFALAVVFIVIGVVSQTASAASPKITISGFVLNDNPNEVPVPAASVRILCRYFTTTILTNEDGYYLTGVNADQCPIGSDIRAFGSWQDKSGVAMTTVQSPNTNMNIFLGHDYSMPEFGWTIGALTVGAGLAGILYLRRRFA